MDSSSGLLFGGLAGIASVYLISGIFMGLIGALVGSSKGRSVAGFWLGFFLSIMGVIIVAVMEPTEAERNRRALTGGPLPPAYVPAVSVAPAAWSLPPSASAAATAAQAAVAAKYPGLWASTDHEHRAQIASLVDAASKRIDAGLPPFPE